MLERLASEPGMRNISGVPVRVGGRTIMLYAPAEGVGEIVSCALREVIRLTEALRSRRGATARSQEPRAARGRPESERAEQQADRACVFSMTQQQLRELVLLHEVTVAATAARDLDSTLHAIIRSLKAHLGYERLWIMLLEGNRLRLRAPLGNVQDLFLELAPGEGVTGWVAQTGEPLLVTDVRREPRYRAGIAARPTARCGRDWGPPSACRSAR